MRAYCASGRVMNEIMRRVKSIMFMIGNNVFLFVSNCKCLLVYEQTNIPIRNNSSRRGSPLKLPVA